MKHQKIIKNHLLLGCLAGLTILTNFATADKVEGLFVGNSYSYFNALNKQVEAMFIAAGNDAEFKRQTTGGYSWKKHWDDNKAPERIKDEADWDFVILQNHSKSSLEKRGEFDKYGDLFIDLVQDRGAEPVLYMTWARKDSPQDQVVITEAYSSLALRHGIKVAPVGLAFKAWMSEHKDVPLHIHDFSHPSPEGSYLAACVIYSTLSGKSPIGLPNIIEGANGATQGDHLVYLDSVRAQHLQETAWVTVSNYSIDQYASEAP